MITTPTKFEAERQNLRAERAIIIKVTNGTSTWMFSDQAIDLSDGAVLPLLVSFPNIKRELQPFTKQLDLHNISFAVSNAPVLITSTGARRRFSDVMGSLDGEEVTVYGMAGGAATGLSDCAILHVGVISTAPVYDREMVRITAFDKIKVRDVELPIENVYDTLVPDSFSVHINSDKKAPIVYGEFTFDIDELTGLGMAKGYRYRKDLQHYCISEHILNEITELWYPERSIPDPVEIQSTSLYADFTGHGIAVNTTAFAVCYCYPSNDEDEGFSTETFSSHTNPANVWDRDLSTVCTIIDNDDNYGSGVALSAVGLFGLQIYESLIASAVESGGQFKIGAIGLDDPGVTISTGRLRLYHGFSSTDRYTLDFIFTRDGSSWSTSPSWTDLPTTYKTLPYTLGIYVLTSSYDSNGISDDTDLMDIYQARMLLRYKPVWPETCWAACKGREFGSWIDGAGRSNSYNAGDLIEDPAFVVEDMLRTYLGFATSEIDEASFDAAANASIVCRLNIHDENKKVASKFIREIAEQSTFAFTWSSAGLARLIDLSNNTPTTTRIIPFSQILDGKIKVSESDWLVNEMIINSRYQQEYGVYRDSEVVSNSTSQTTYQRIGHYEANWQNVAGTSVTTLKAHLITGGDNLWATRQPVITFSTLGMTNADLEPGDWIEVESDPADAIMKLGGSSWSGLQFLLTTVGQRQDRTDFVAIQLFG